MFLIEAIVFGLLITGIFVVLKIASVPHRVVRKKTSTSAAIQNTDELNNLRRQAQRKTASFTVLQQLATACYEAQLYQEAFENYARLLATVENAHYNPKRIDVRRCKIRQGISAVYINKYNTAYTLLSQVMADKTGLDEELLFGLGLCEYYRKNYDLAIRYFNYYNTKKFPQNSKVDRFLGLSHYKMKHYTEAATILKSQSVDALKAKDNELIYVLANSHYQCGDKSEALRFFQPLCADPVYGPTACLATGNIHLSQENTATAITDFKTGLNYLNIRTELMLELKYALAKAHLSNKEITEAVELFQQIRSINPTFKDVAQEIQKYGATTNSGVYLSTYFKGNSTDFAIFAQKLLKAYFKCNFTIDETLSVDTVQYYDIFGVLAKSKYIEDSIQVRFYRIDQVITETHLREFYQSMKEHHVERGYCFTLTSYSPGVYKFIEHRLIDLCGKEDFMELLSQIN